MISMKQEADRVADLVIRLPQSKSGHISANYAIIQRKCTPCKVEEKKKPIMRKAENVNPDMQVFKL